MKNRTVAKVAAAPLLLVASMVVSGCAEWDAAVNRELPLFDSGDQAEVEPPANPSPVEEQTNVQRGENGVPTLDASEMLRDSACAKADDMIARDYWGHFAPDGSGDPFMFIRGAGVDYSTAAENLFYSTLGGPDPVDSWMQSPGHRENVVNPDFTRVGVCVRTAAYQGLPEAHLYVQHFATPIAER
ncbi:CAP domain-containing protein [Dietzia cercidiphylli]|uniref:CAP domain-containing protein n=1 Tax=Dietzia cercidiphylli TaxID=498199 RepID=UPI00223BF234|nr:CAP domain-containing protein [Dietzia cercidiphylli]MCT1516456.1 CAP domain-containing protein [Dietzia cercidiphylli]